MATTKKLNQSEVLKWSLRGAIGALNKKLSEYRYQIFKQEREQKLNKITIHAFYYKLKTIKDSRLKEFLTKKIQELQTTLASNKRNIACNHKVFLEIKEEIKKHNQIADQLGIRLWKN